MSAMLCCHKCNLSPCRMNVVEPSGVGCQPHIETTSVNPIRSRGKGTRRQGSGLAERHAPVTPWAVPAKTMREGLVRRGPAAGG